MGTYLACGHSHTTPFIPPTLLLLVDNDNSFWKLRYYHVPGFLEILAHRSYYSY